MKTRTIKLTLTLALAGVLFWSGGCGADGGSQPGNEQSQTPEIVEVPGAKKTGDSAPLFALPSASGETVNLADLLKKGPVVLNWYRGGWCPYCNTHLKALRDAMPEIEKLGATLAAIAPELPDNSMSTAEKNALEFLVLSDVGNAVAKEYGIVFTLTDETKAKYKDYGIDLPKYNGDETWTLPHPATYVIDQGGVIRYASVNPDYGVRTDPGDILAALQKLQ